MKWKHFLTHFYPCLISQVSFLYLVSKLCEESKWLEFFYLLQSCLVWISKSTFSRRTVYNISQAMPMEIKHILIISEKYYFFFLIYFGYLWFHFISCSFRKILSILCSGLAKRFTVFSDRIISGLFCPDKPQLQY